jgi:hypothetical protein
MLRHTTFLIAVAISSVSVAADKSRPLADAIKAINEQAAKLPESRTQPPLTEDEVVKCIESFRRPTPVPGDLESHLKTLSDEEFRGLKAVAETRRLPKDIILRQFVRYNDGTGVEHGWWVRLILMRQDKCPFALPIRQESMFRRPYTQKEREFQDEVHRTGSFPTMGRLVAYFDDDPQFGKVQEFSKAEADSLAAAVKKAIEERKADDLLKAYYWEKAAKETRTWVRGEMESLTKHQLLAVSVSPRRFGGRLTQWQGLTMWDSNLPVLGYIVVKFADNDLPNTVWLEFGHTQDGARLVNYIVSRDDFPRMKGKPLSKGGFRVHSFLTPLPENGCFDDYTQIDNAPDEMPGLRNANLELWKIKPTPR